MPYNGGLLKFPSVACGGFSHLTAEDTVYYKIFGNLEKAINSSLVCPPTDHDNFVLVARKVNINFWNGFAWSCILVWLGLLVLICISFVKSL